jgi:transposase
LPFYKFLLADGMEKENTKLIRTRCVRLKLTKSQKKLFNKWYSHYKFTYNQALGMVKDNHTTNTKINEFSWISNNQNIEKKASSNTFFTKYDLRDLIVPSHNCSSREWISETPTAIRARAVFEMHDRYKTCLSNLKNKNIKFFDMKFKCKKHLKWTMNIPKEAIHTPQSDTCKIHEIKSSNGTVLESNVSQKECTICKNLPLNQIKMYSSGWIKTTENIDKILHDPKIHFDGLNYYILIPYKKSMIKNNKRNKVCSIDPGVRKFQTVYSPEDNSIINIGKHATSKLYNHLLHLDNVISRLNKKDTKKKNKFKILKIKILNKIKNLQKELHNKTSRFLCDNFNNILTPKLTKNNDIIKNKKRTIHTKTVRNMVVLGHSKFIELLKIKTAEYENVYVDIVTEEYTSQTCLRCSKRTKMSGEIYKCNNCKFKCDRDIVGSINILLKNWGLMV